MVVACVGCAVHEPAPSDDDPVPEDPTTASPGVVAGTSPCELEGPDVYTPYSAEPSPIGTVAELPWRGVSSNYPDGNEDFSGYPTLPSDVECGSAKGVRDYVDVTAGCLRAVTAGTYTRGQVVATDDGYFRAVALGHTGADPRPVKWTDQRVEYRFFYRDQVGTNGYPGFKAFARYRTEDDLYVASWRMDGVVQIQQKRCGAYSALAILPTFGAPSPASWHTIRFDAIGDVLELVLDGQRVLTVSSGTFSWGTAGIRIDAMNGAYLDDWRVSAP